MHSIGQIKTPGIPSPADKDDKRHKPKKTSECPEDPFIAPTICQEDFMFLEFLKPPVVGWLNLLERLTRKRGCEVWVGRFEAEISVRWDAPGSGREMIQF